MKITDEIRAKAIEQIVENGDNGHLENGEVYLVGGSGCEYELSDFEVKFLADLHDEICDEK